MRYRRINIIRNTALSFVLLSALTAYGQEALTDSVAGPVSSEIQIDETVEEVMIPPLFEYVVAPDELPDLQSRTDYLMDNFWNPFDFKNTVTVDQNALNHAFGVYAEAMNYASEKKIEASIKKLVNNIKNNTGLTIQFTKAAEETFFGPRAKYWADAIYLQFLKNYLDNKKIDENRKTKYRKQEALLSRTAVGSQLPAFNVVTMKGEPAHFAPAKEFTLIEFAQQGDDNNRYANLKLDISGKINDLLAEDRLGVAVVVMSDTASPFNCPEKWQAYVSDNAAEIMDLRTRPCFYIIDKDRKIVAKNQTVDTAISILETLTAPKQ